MEIYSFLFISTVSLVMAEILDSLSGFDEREMKRQSANAIRHIAQRRL